jgi:hypothetical protein
MRRLTNSFWRLGLWPLNLRLLNLRPLGSWRLGSWRVFAMFGFAVFALMFAVPANPAAAYEERATTMPDGKGSVPRYRQDGRTLLVCKTDKVDFDIRIAAFPSKLRAMNLARWTQCQKSGFRHLQAAVNAVKQPGMNSRRAAVAAANPAGTRLGALGPDRDPRRQGPPRRELTEARPLGPLHRRPPRSPCP